MAEALDLDAIRARADAATEGPWITSTDTSGVDNSEIYAEAAWFEEDGHRYYGRRLIAVGGEGNLNEADAEFIAAAREDIPALLGEVERLRARVHEAVDECQRRHVKYVSRCDQFDVWSRWARQRFEEQGSRYWGMTSEANRLVIVSIIAERDEARAELEQLRDYVKIRRAVEADHG
jgi:hypothetical protein